MFLWSAILSFVLALKVHREESHNEIIKITSTGYLAIIDHSHPSIHNAKLPIAMYNPRFITAKQGRRMSSCRARKLKGITLVVIIDEWWKQISSWWKYSLARLECQCLTLGWGCRLVGQESWLQHFVSLKFQFIFQRGRGGVGTCILTPRSTRLTAARHPSRILWKFATYCPQGS